jgi:hypothetical protein
LDPSSPVHPDEIILRRVPEQKMELDRCHVSADAFAPHATNDAGGISVYREQFHSPTEVTQTFRSGGTKPVWCARLRAGDLFKIGLSVNPDPLGPDERLPERLGHALIPEINSGNAKSKETAQYKQRLKKAVFEIVGPFDPPQRADEQ